MPNHSEPLSIPLLPSTTLLLNSLREQTPDSEGFAPIIKQKFVTGVCRFTKEFLEDALFLKSARTDPKARIEDFFKLKYGADFIQVAGYYSLQELSAADLATPYLFPPDVKKYFDYQARAIIWKEIPWEVT